MSDSATEPPRDERTWKVEKTVFFGSSAIILTIVGLAAMSTEAFMEVVDPLQDAIVEHFGWFYTLSVAAFFILALWAMFSRVGQIRLGKDDEKPAYSYPAWISMLFSAGMGIGLVFNGVAEPVMHFSAPPSAEAGTMEAAHEAMQFTFMHWGIHAWAIYAVTGLFIAYAAHRKGLPLAVRSMCHPVLGDRIYGPIGDIIEIPAAIGTLFGVAASLGMGVTQVNAGLAHLTGMEQSATVQVILIAVITIAATASVVSGLDSGILALSKLNMVLATALLAFVFVFGPTTAILRSLVQNTGDYLQALPEMSFFTGIYANEEWVRSWTYVYWPWWIAWSPFVGIFVARISRGRTVREFVGGCLLVPTALTFLWMTTFGESAIRIDMAENMALSAQVADNMPVSLYVFLEHFPVPVFSAIVATVLIVTFFVTSSDSGSFVVDIITSGGVPNPPVLQKVYWAFLEGAVAAALLLAGGLAALQGASIVLALPFCALLWLGGYAFVRSTGEDSSYVPTSAETVQEAKARARDRDGGG